MNTLLEIPQAAGEVELSQLDLRYEHCRMKQAALEERLLGSIAQRGIEEALEGVDVPAGRILLNGFKRYRCARKLHLNRVPYVSLGQDESSGIVSLLRACNPAPHRTLNLLEQAGFVEQLRQQRHLSVAQIAQELGRSKSWVSMRLGLVEEMSELVRTQLF